MNLKRAKLEYFVSKDIIGYRFGEVRLGHNGYMYCKSHYWLSAVFENMSNLAPRGTVATTLTHSKV